MAAPGGGGRDVSSKGHFKSDVAETPEIDWSYESGQLNDAPADGKDDMDIKLSPAGAPASPKGSVPESPMGASALSGDVLGSPLSGSSSAVPVGAPKDGKDGKDGKDTKTAAPLDHKGAAVDDSDKESFYNGPGSYGHTEGESDMDIKGGKDCEKCKGGDKKPHGGKGGDKPPPCDGKGPDCPKPSPSTSCATTSTPAPPPPPPASTPACPLASNGVTPCAAPKSPPTEKAKTPEGETKPPVQVGAPAPTAPPSKPEAPKTPAGAKPPKPAPSTPVTQHGAASGLSVGPLSQLAVVGVVSYAVIALIL